MQSHELTQGRVFGVRFDPKEDFFDTLNTFCRERDVRQGYIPMFLAAFSEIDVVGTCEKLTDTNAPVWSRVHLANVEAIGCGTIAYDKEAAQILPHVHTSVGLKEHSAMAHTSHLLKATVQFITEMIVVEVAEPSMTRPLDPNLYDVPRLLFGSTDLP